MVDPTEFGGAAEGENRVRRDLAGESDPAGIDVREVSVGALPVGLSLRIPPDRIRL